MKKVTIYLAVTLLSIAVSAHNHKGDSKVKSNTEKLVQVEIGKKGFQPNPIQVKKGEKLVLNIKRTTKKTCMTALKNPKTGKLVDLPLNKEVRFEIGSYDQAKKVDLLCGMDMKAGVVQVN